MGTSVSPCLQEVEGDLVEVRDGPHVERDDPALAL